MSPYKRDQYMFMAYNLANKIVEDAGRIKVYARENVTEAEELVKNARGTIFYARVWACESVWDSAIEKLRKIACDIAEMSL